MEDKSSGMEIGGSFFCVLLGEWGKRVGCCVCVCVRACIYMENLSVPSYVPLDEAHLVSRLNLLLFHFLRICHCYYALKINDIYFISLETAPAPAHANKTNTHETPFHVSYYFIGYEKNITCRLYQPKCEQVGHISQPINFPQTLVAYVCTKWTNTASHSTKSKNALVCEYPGKCMIKMDREFDENHFNKILFPFK